MLGTPQNFSIGISLINSINEKTARCVRNLEKLGRQLKGLEHKPSIQKPHIQSSIHHIRVARPTDVVLVALTTAEVAPLTPKTFIKNLATLKF